MPFSGVLTPEKAFSIVSKSAGTLIRPWAHRDLSKAMSKRILYISIASPVVIEFRWTEEPPYRYRDMAHDLDKWKRYFNELYHDAQRSTLKDTAFNSFWHGLRFNGKAVDPFTAPPNYVKALDPWADKRADIGYGLYWSHYFTTVNTEYLYASKHEKQRTNVQEPTWTWYGAAFDLSLRPPGFIESNVKTDPIHLNRLARGYLDCWEQYFTDLYEANVPTPDESAGEYYARIKLKDKGSYLNVRAKASSSSKSLAKIKNNQPVIVLGKPDKDGWVKVIYRMDVAAKKCEDGTYTVSANPGYGYVKANYLSKES